MIIEIGGERRELRFNQFASDKYEEKTGKTLIITDQDNIQVRDIVALIWAGLLWQDKMLSINTVREWIDDYREDGNSPLNLLPYIMYALAEQNWYGKEAGEKITEMLTPFLAKGKGEMNTEEG